jgi:hypothetical protein
MKTTAFIALVVAIGCAGPARQDQALGISQSQLARLSDRAVSAVTCKEVIELPDGSLVPIDGDYDAARDIRFRFENRPVQRVLVSIPRKESDPSVHLFTTFCFDPISSRIIRVWVDGEIQGPTCSFQ